MAKKSFGCKKCGGVIEIEIQPWSNHLDIRVLKDGELQDKFGKIVMLCKCKTKTNSICGNELGEWLFSAK